MYAAGLAAAYQAEFKLNYMLFHPGRVDPVEMDTAACAELGARLPGPAYLTQPGVHAPQAEGMLSDDVVLPSDPVASPPIEAHVILM